MRRGREEGWSDLHNVDRLSRSFALPYALKTLPSQTRYWTGLVIRKYVWKFSAGALFVFRRITNNATAAQSVGLRSRRKVANSSIPRTLVERCFDKADDKVDDEDSGVFVEHPKPITSCHLLIRTGQGKKIIGVEEDGRLDAGRPAKHAKKREKRRRCCNGYKDSNG